MNVRKELDIEEKKRLVAVHFSGGLGSFIMLTPAIQALAKHFDAEIDVVSDRAWTDSRRIAVQDYCEHWPLINRIMDFQDGFKKDDYVQLFYTKHGEMCEALQYFAENAGYEASDADWRTERSNEVDCHMNEVRRLGYRGPVPDLFCTQGERKESFDRMVQEDGETFRIGFCNGCEREEWPHFGELARLLGKFLDPYKIRIYLFGRGDREKEWAESVTKENEGAEREVVSFMDCGIGEIVHMVSGMHLFVTTDTGLMHVADALRVPTVALFGPTLVSRNGPYNREHRIARSPLKCVPCQHGPDFDSCGECGCMGELKPWMVVRTVREYLHELYARSETRMPGFREGLSRAFSLVEKQ